jgi:hypothetical protein
MYYIFYNKKRIHIYKYINIHAYTCNLITIFKTAILFNTYSISQNIHIYTYIYYYIYIYIHIYLQIHYL